MTWRTLSPHTAFQLIQFDLIINTSEIIAPSVSQFFRFNKSVPPVGGEPLLVSQEPY